MTTLTYRPELTIALADDSSLGGLSADARDELKRISQQIVTLIVPLTRVSSSTEAENLVTRAVPSYTGLARQLQQLLSRPDAAALKRRPFRPLADSIRESTMVPVQVKEDLQGVLESVDAYMNWFRRRYGGETDEAKQDDFTPLVQQVVGPLTRVEVALMAICLALDEDTDSTADAIPTLAEFADRCWTEVEDLFLSLATYDDEGGTVPLSEVRANLGL